MSHFEFQVTVLGDYSTGKTSIIRQFSNRTHSHKYIATVGLDFISANIEIDERDIRFLICDTAGPDKYAITLYHCFKAANGFLVVYDKSNISSFNSACNWVELIKSSRPDNPLIILVGNKNDKVPLVSTDKAIDFSVKNDVHHLEVCSKNYEEIRTLFIIIARRILMAS